MGKIQPVVFCVPLGVNWDPDSLIEGVSSLVGSCDRDALPVVVGPEFLFASFQSGRPISPLLPSDDRLAALVDFTSLSNRALVIPGTVVMRTTRGLRNTATVMYQGQVLLQVDKLKQGGPAEPKQWEKILPPMQQANVHPDTFLLSYGKNSETRFGVEICTDKGEMRSFLEAQQRNRPAKWPEVYIQTSYGMSLSNFITWNMKRKKFMYRCLIRGNETWIERKYTANTTENPPMEEFSDFALHDLTPGVFIQSDGHVCRVGYKFPMRRCYTLVPPIRSVIFNRGWKTNFEIISAHLFPSVNVQLLRPYWI